MRLKRNSETLGPQPPNPPTLNPYIRATVRVFYLNDPNQETIFTVDPYNDNAGPDL